MAGVLIAPALASAAPNGPGASGWHLGYYNPSPMGDLSLSQVAPSESGLATFNFTNQPNTALLINTQGNSSYRGNDLGKTVTATFSIAGAPASDFIFYPFGGTEPASVRLFFETSNAGGFAYTNYWWSQNSASSFQYLGNGTFTVTATLSPSSINWGDWDGNADYSNSAFSAAASNVTGMGLSFGGGGGYEDGVGTADGSGTFTLTSFSIS